VSVGKKRRRRVKLGRTRIAGVGTDGNTYGVVTLHTNATAYRRKPCATCPFRRDAVVGRFPAQAYRESAQTAYDGAMPTFACHESGTEAPATCAGFLLVNADHNLGVRIRAAVGDLDLDAITNPDAAPLYGSYREMAIANGVQPDDPTIAQCRANGYDDLPTTPPKGALP
jgi:hypothetical protein